MTDERGQIMPVLLATLTALLFGGVVLFQVGQATDLQAEAQTGAVAEACLYIHGQVTLTFPTLCDDRPAAAGTTRLNVTGMPFPDYVNAWGISFDTRLVSVEGLSA